MENVLPGQDDPANPPPFWCHICRVSCVSAINLQSHFLGSRHKKAEDALKNNQEADGEDLPKPGESLEDQINTCKNAEPALGLEYIYEFQNHGYSRYECRLCNCFLGRTHMFMHIVGARHRIYYLSKHHPSLGITNAYILKGPKKLKKLREVCVRVEKDFGRKQINVVKGEYKMFSFCNAPAPPPCVNYQPDSKLQKMDFTNDEFIDLDDRSTAEELVVTFLELKTAHEASLRNQTIGQESLPQPSAGQEKDLEEIKDNKTDNDDHSDSDIDLCGMECNTDLDGFPSNRELFEYLASFKVFELGDVHFLLKVSEKLRNALVDHKKCCQEDAERKKMECNTNAQDKINQSVVPSLEQSVTNQESKCSNKKLSFRISGPSTEKSPLVSSQFLSNMQQDFAAKSNQNKMAVSTTHLDELNLTADSVPSFKPVFDSTQDVQDQRFLSSNLNNRGTSIAQPRVPFSKPPERAGAASIIGQFPNENVKGSAIQTPFKSFYPLELAVNSAGSVTTHAVNLHEVFKNVACFASPIASNTPEQMWNSSLLVPLSSLNAQELIANSAGSAFLRPPSAHEMFRNVAGSACVRTSNSYRQLGNSAALDHFRAPFPPQLNTAPIASSPVFPVAKDDVTAKFFESLKDMEVSEVVSTLNKITATNPALQGIHVPSLVQYLMDTGKLKSSSNNQEKI